MRTTLGLTLREGVIILTTGLLTFLIVEWNNHIINWQIFVGIALAIIISVLFYYYQRKKFKDNSTAEVNRAIALEKGIYFYNHPQPMWIYEVDSLKFLDVNDAAIQKYGYSRNEFLGMTLLNIRPREDYSSLLDYMEQELKSYKSGDIWKHLTKSGKEIIVRLNAHSINYNGKEARLIAVNDITDAVQAKERIEQQRSFLSSILESMEDFIWVVSPDLNLLDANKVFLDSINRHSKKEIQKGDKVLLDDYPPKIVQFWRKKYLRALNGQVVRFDYSEPSPNGDNIKQFTLNPVKNKQGIIEYLVCNGTDVTSYIKVQQRLEEAIKQYELISKSTNDAIWDLDLLDNSLIWGQGIENRFGYKLKETTLSWWEERVHPGDRERVNDTLYEVINGKENHWRDGYRFMAMDGTYKHVIDQGYVMRDKDGMGYRMVGAIQDIDNLVRSRAEIDKLSLVASKTSNAVIITDEKEQIEWVNEAFTKLTGYGMDEVIGKVPGHFLQGPKSDPETVKIMKEKLKLREGFSVELINYRKDGSEYWVEMTVTPVDYNGNGEIDNFIALETDISARKQRQKLLEHKNQKLQEIAFITAHELRKPVANILGIGSLMDAHKDDPEYLASLAPKIVASCKELDYRINEIVQNSYDAERENELSPDTEL